MDLSGAAAPLRPRYGHQRNCQAGRHRAVSIEDRSGIASRVRQRLAAIRHLLDWRVTSQVVPVTPAALMACAAAGGDVGGRGRDDLHARKINRRQCEAAHTSSRDRRAISGSASSFRWGRPRRGGRHDENQPVEQERAEGRSRPALARGAPPARAAAHTAYCSATFSAQAAPLSF